MTHENSTYVLVCVGLVSAFVLVGCGGGGTPTMPQASTLSKIAAGPQDQVENLSVNVSSCPCYNSLYSFGEKSNDGYQPDGRLASVNGALYGTTEYGGTGSEGTVFSITTSGVENVLQSFSTPSNSAWDPDSGLVELNGVLYGVTGWGGQNGYGTVFSITPSGTYNVLHSFGAGTDGTEPIAPLTPLNGVLYGTTLSTRSAALGTLYSVTTSGVEKVLHHFGRGTDGYQPTGVLVNVNGLLYGTTPNGGANHRGTVYKITTGGQETVVYNFGASATDGNSPRGGLTYVKGVLYGTTQYGGANNKGTIFSVTPAGSESVLYSFTGTSDGTQPLVELTYMNGVLYGTTSGGNNIGGGSVFGINIATNAFSVLHRFNLVKRAMSLPSPLLALNGRLYGMTSRGGKTNLGNVFSLKP